MLTRKLRNFFIMLGIIALLLPAKAFANLIYQPFSTTDFETGTIAGGNTIYRDWLVQSNTGDIVIAPAPGGKGGNAAKISISKNENFSNVANGSPRAELQSEDMLAQNTTYTFSFSTYIPTSTIFDISGYQQRMDFFQTHQNTPDMSNGWAIRGLGLDGSNYYVDDYTVSNKQVLGSASADVGKWVNWLITYKVSPTDGSGLYTITKNGTQIYSDTRRTFYSGQSPIYCKFGIYKWDWLNYSTQVSNVTMYFDDIILSKGTNSTTTATPPAAPSNLTVTGLSKGATTGADYVNLSWKDNATNATGNLLQQSINSTSNFQTIQTLGSTVSSCSVNIGANPTAGTYYYRIRSSNSTAQSQPSNVVSEQISSTPTTTSSIPAAPSNLSSAGVTKNSSGQVLVGLKWKNNATNATSLELLEAINSTSNFKAVATPAASASTYSLNIGAAPTHGVYYYEIVAINSAGQSKPSNIQPLGIN